MRFNIASVLLLAGTVVGCASNPPPPPPPAPEPMPAPAPMPPAVMAPMSGTYRGTAELAGTGRSCHAPRGTQTARVRNDSIMVAGMRGKIGSDGTVTGRGLSGTVNGGNADLTVMRGRCSYHYTLSNGSTSMGGSTMSGNGASPTAPQPGDTGSAQMPQPANSLPQ